MLVRRAIQNGFRMAVMPGGSRRMYSDPAGSAAIASRKGLVLGAYRTECDEPKLTSTAERFNERVGGKLLEMLKDTIGVTKGKGRGFIFNNLDPEFWSVVVADLGKEGAGYNELEGLDEARENVRMAAGTGVTRLRNEGINQILVEDFGFAQESAEGSALTAWSYQEYKDPKHRKITPTLELFESTDADGWERGLVFAESQNLVRRLCEMAANHLTPLAFAQAIADLLCPCNINCDIRSKDWLELRRFECLLTIAKSTCEPPLLLELKYCGAAFGEQPILMTGKGTTYDSGGLFLRRDQWFKNFNIEEHRADMCGAAMCVAAIRAAAIMQLPVNITAVIALTENMPSGMAMKSGDIITALNGKTVAVHSPDMEGRMAMADCILYGITLGTPKLVMTMGTMTDGVSKLLGEGCAGCYSNSRAIWKQLHRAGAITGDRLWKLPLFKYYTDRVTEFCEVDVSNVGNGKGEPCLCAAFIKEFVPCVDWLHIDNQGVGMIIKSPLKPYLRVGTMSGRPTRTVIQLLYQLACPQTEEAC